jgi:hypothetical protein
MQLSPSACEYKAKSSYASEQAVPSMPSSCASPSAAKDVVHAVVETDAVGMYSLPSSLAWVVDNGPVRQSLHHW